MSFRISAIRSDESSDLFAAGEVLVTGGAGFLGSHLVEHLLAAGHRVHVLDNLSSGSLDNLRHLTEAQATGGRLRVTIGSADDAELARASCESAVAVFHLAGMVGVQRLASDPMTVMQRNLHCTERMLEAASAAEVPILITSSSEVYGQGPVPFRETDPVQPGATEGLRGGYACAKAMGEWMALALARQRGLQVVVARLFNAVGVRQSPAYGMVLPRFLAQARRGEAITVFGDGTQTRCFGAAGEIVTALAQLLESPAARGQVVNVGSDREVSVGRLAELVQQATGASAPIVQVPLEQVFPRGFVDPPRRVPCLERLRTAIGWVPERPIESIVEELAAVVADPAEEALMLGADSLG